MGVKYVCPHSFKNLNGAEIKPREWGSGDERSVGQMKKLVIIILDLGLSLILEDLENKIYKKGEEQKKINETLEIPERFVTERVE